MDTSSGNYWAVLEIFFTNLVLAAVSVAIFTGRFGWVEGLAGVVFATAVHKRAIREVRRLAVALDWRADYQREEGERKPVIVYGGRSWQEDDVAEE